MISSFLPFLVVNCVISVEKKLRVKESIFSIIKEERICSSVGFAIISCTGFIESNYFKSAS